MKAEPIDPARYQGPNAVPNDPINEPSNPAFPPPSPQSGVYVPPELDGGATPYAADQDPGDTASAEATGQDGDPTEAKKKKGLAWT